MKLSVLDHLESYKRAHGEEAWRGEVTRLALKAIQTSPRHSDFWKDLTKDFEWLDWDELERTAKNPSGEKLSPELMLAELVKQRMPGIKSQAQYDAAVGAMDALNLVLNAILTSNPAKETEAREALDIALLAASKATEMTLKLEDTPEAATSESAEQFKKEPAQFHEFDQQRRLLAELDSIKDLPDLNTWYKDNRSRIDIVVTQSIRDPLLDAIRKKKSEFLA